MRKSHKAACDFWRVNHIIKIGMFHISNISMLSNLMKLETLHLHKNKISDISALRNLTNLKELRLEDNQIADYSPIEELNIETVYK